MSSYWISMFFSFSSFINSSWLILWDFSCWYYSSISVKLYPWLAASVLRVSNIVLPDTSRGMLLNSPSKRGCRYTSSQLSLDWSGSLTILPSSMVISTYSFYLRHCSTNRTISAGTFFPPIFHWLFSCSFCWKLWCILHFLDFSQSETRRTNSLRHKRRICLCALCFFQFGGKHMRGLS